MRRSVGDVSNVLPLFPVEQVQEQRHVQLIKEHAGIEPGDLLPSISYMPSAFLQAVLPYREPRNTSVWAKGNGKVSMVVTAGNRVVNQEIVNDKGKLVNGSVVMSRGLPFGSLPRLVLSWVATEAITTRQRKIQLGRNMRDFMSRIGCQHVSGGDNGTATRTFQQATRLFSCTISLVRNNTSVDDHSLSGMPSMPIVDRCDILSENARASDMGGSYLVLSEWFFNEVTSHGVPCDLDAIIQLRNSALALDIYAWLTWRMSFIQKPTVIRWETLHEQFGAQCANLRKFRQSFRFALGHVLDVYRQANVDDKANPAGILLLPSTTHIPRQSNARLAGF